MSNFRVYAYLRASTKEQDEQQIMGKGEVHQKFDSCNKATIHNL
jgi:DNA invertase Pin-like site-specific DNA recombinase